MKFFNCMVVFFICVFASSVNASDISIYKRDLYDRITIENAGAGAIEKNADNLQIPFSSTIADNFISNSRTLKSYSQVDKETVLMLNDAVTDTRHFRIGNRIILDIFFDADKLSALNTPVETPTEEKPEVAEQPEVAEVPVEEEEPKLKQVPQEKAPELVTATQVDEQPPLAQDSALADATIISISSTKPFGLTIFERLGRLFVVTDQPDMAIPPQVAGNGAKLGWVMKEIPMDNGKAWSMPLPKGSHVRPEGRGLIWRAIISDVAPDLATSDIRKRVTNPQNPIVDILMPNASKLLRFTDPDYGDDLAVVTVKRSTSRMLIPYEFIDFEIIPAVVGTVIKPKSDGLRVVSGDQFISVSNANGLIMAPDSQDKIVEAYLKREGETISNFRRAQTTLDRVFYFSDWGGGINPHEYIEKRKELDQFLSMASKESKLGVVLDLVKLTLSQAMGQEALGYLRMAGEMNPQINETSEYQALRGAAHFLAGQYDLAEKYFSADELSNISEAQLWLAASLAELGNDEKAMEVYNDNATLTAIYPYEIKRAINAPLALAALNQDNGQQALEFIELVDREDALDSAEDRATIAYLKGRAQSITGRPDEAISNLYKASMGSKLGPYGIRSELLLIQDELAREVIEVPEAIQRMERLRFAWRGGALEPQIYKALGQLYIDSGKPRRGLSILKRAATNVETAQERRAIVRDMAEAYKSIFIGEQFEQTDPLVAVAVYDEFKELTPIGEEGNLLIDRLADKLMSINMMSRATNVLKDKMDRLGSGQHAIKTGLRIAAIQLLDFEPEEAIKTLAQIDKMISLYSGDDKGELNEKIVLLKARALAETGQAQQALFMTEGLDDTDDVIRLRIDTAWKTSNWVAVTDNLAKLLARENITLANPPTNEQAQLILNQAVALSLSNQYDALQRFADAYDLPMKQTPLYKTFLVVTRPQNISNLADRETLLDVTSEVDLFQEFLQKMEK